MVSEYTYIILFSSIIMFFLGLVGALNLRYIFPLAIGINIFPVAFLPPISMNEARFMSIPLSYIPFILGGFIVILKSGLKLQRDYNRFYVFAMLFLAYVLVRSFFFKEWSGSDLVYYSAWVYNFAVCIAVASYFSRVKDEGEIYAAGKVLVYVVVAGCLVGLVRYMLGIDSHANFMPLINRNGTVLLLVMVLPLLFYIYENRKISRGIVFISLLIVILSALAMASRSGIIGVILSIVLYYSRFSVKGVANLFFVVVALVSVLLMPFAHEAVDRLSGSVTTAKEISIGGVEEGENDYRRYRLADNAIKVLRDNWMFGVGVGLGNYKEQLRRIEGDERYVARAHNFYLSYLVEFGLVGILLLVMLFASMFVIVWQGGERARSFRVMLVVLAVMMGANEYILLPMVWFLFGMVMGISVIYKRTRVGSPVVVGVRR